MKITRYPIGRTTLSEKQEERAAVLSPAEAAQAAGAKYAAISSIAGSASKTLVTLDEANERSREAADRIVERTSAARTEQRVKMAHAEAERLGVPVEELQATVNGIMDEEKEWLTSNVTSRDGKARLPMILDSQREMVNLETQHAGVLLTAARTTRVAMESISELAAAKNWTEALSVLDVSVEAGAFSPEVATNIRNELIKGLNQQTIDNAVEKFNGLYQTDKDAANEFRKSILKEPDADARNAMLQGIEGAKQNIDQVTMLEQGKKDLLKAIEVSDLVTDIQTGAVTKTIEGARADFKAGVYGDPETENALRNRDAVINAIQQNTESMSAVAELEATLKQGLYPDNTKEARKAMDEKLARTAQAEGWTPEQYIVGELALAKQTGFASQRATNQLNGMATSQEGFVRGMPLYFAFTDDTDFKLDLNIPQDIEAMGASVMAMVKDAGLPIGPAAEVVWKNRNQTTQLERKDRQQKWEGKSEVSGAHWAKDSSDSFEAMVTSGEFDKATFWLGAKLSGEADQDETETQYNKDILSLAKAHYDYVYKMMRVDHGETNVKLIEDFAMQAVANKFAMTNVNGDWELMMHAPRHKMDGVRGRMVRDIQNAGTSYQVIEDGKVENIDGGFLEDERVRFETIPAREGAYTREGELKWRVFYDDMPLLTADGNAVTVTADPKGMEDYALAHEEMRVVAEEEAELRREIEQNIWKPEEPPKEPKNMGDQPFRPDEFMYGEPIVVQKRREETQRVKALEQRQKVLEEKRKALNEVSF